MNKINKREVIKGAVIFLLCQIILIVGAIIKLNMTDALIATSVTAVGFGLIWLFIRWGMFSFTSYGSRKVGVAFANRKNNKLGSYSEKDKKKAKTPNEIIEINKDKSKQGICLLLVLGTIELIISIILAFA